MAIDSYIKDRLVEAVWGTWSLMSCDYLWRLVLKVPVVTFACSMILALSPSLHVPDHYMYMI